MAGPQGSGREDGHRRSPYAGGLGELGAWGCPSPSGQLPGHAGQLRAVTPYRHRQSDWLCVAAKSISPAASSLSREIAGSVIKCLEKMKQHRRISICRGKGW